MSERNCGNCSNWGTPTMRRSSKAPCAKAGTKTGAVVKTNRQECCSMHTKERCTL